MNNKVLMVVLLDRSGSMSSIQNDMIGGFNTFVQEQREDDLQKGSSTYCSLYRFDGVFESVFKQVPISDADTVRLDHHNFQPRGGTALIDSMVKCIDEVGRELAAMPECFRPSKIVFISITDGEENASVEFTNTILAERIRHQREKYNWQFVFLGANQDSFANSGQLNINKASTLNFAANSQSVNAAFQCVSRGMSAYKSASPSDVYTLDQENV